jgi:NAD+ kinase
MRVLLIANKSKSSATSALEQVRSWLASQDISYKISSKGAFCPEDPEFLELREAVSDYDLVCAFGGDGTILQSARIIGRSGVPLLGYNFGRLGFLAGATDSELISALQAALDGRAKLDQRTLLEATVSFSDNSTSLCFALNEMAVSRGHFGRVVSLDLSIDEHYIDSISGDGLIVSTATGSTAYALSAGGPFISPGYEGLCIVPVSPHTLNARSIVTAPSELITLVPTATNRQRVFLFFDGEEASSKAEDDPQVVRIEVRACPEKLQLLRSEQSSFYNQISQTFFRRGNA